MVNAFIALLKDGEAEVRAAAAKQLPGVSALLDLDSVERILLPCIKDMVSDGNQHVRSALAANICSLAPVIGKER